MNRQLGKVSLPRLKRSEESFILTWPTIEARGVVHLSFFDFLPGSSTRPYAEKRKAPVAKGVNFTKKVAAIVKK